MTEEGWDEGARGTKWERRTSVGFGKGCPCLRFGGRQPLGKASTSGDLASALEKTGQARDFVEGFWRSGWLRQVGTAPVGSVSTAVRRHVGPARPCEVCTMPLSALPSW